MENFSNEDFDNKNETNLESELKKVDDYFEHSLNKLEILEEKNMEVLMGKFEKDGNYEKILDNKIITDAFNLMNKIENSLEKKFQNLAEEEKYKFYINSKILILNDKMITKIANLDIYENLEELYLQRNFIKTIEGFKYLKNLQILDLNNNYIKKIENLKHLKNLQILDIGDNVIEQFEISEVPENVYYLYLFDNIFFDNFSILKLRSLCIKNLPNIIRLDYLNISQTERFILIDDSNFKKNRIKILEKKLEYVKDHYKQMKIYRNNILNEFQKTIGNLNNNNDSDNRVVTVNKNESNSYEYITEIKMRSQTRMKEFEKSSEERMKELKNKVEEIRNKIKLEPLLDDKRKEKIKEKINKAIKFEEKIKIAEEMTTRIESANNRIKNREIDKPIETEQNISFYNKTKENELYKTENSSNIIVDANLDESRANSLLTDHSDLSFIKKKK